MSTGRASATELGVEHHKKEKKRKEKKRNETKRKKDKAPRVEQIDLTQAPSPWPQQRLASESEIMGDNELAHREKIVNLIDHTLKMRHVDREKLESSLEEHSQVKDLLADLPSRLRHPAMIPMG